jgi:hypothetical protein
MVPGPACPDAATSPRRTIMVLYGVWTWLLQRAARKWRRGDTIHLTRHGSIEHADRQQAHRKPVKSLKNNDFIPM